MKFFFKRIMQLLTALLCLPLVVFSAEKSYRYENLQDHHSSRRNQEWAYQFESRRSHVMSGTSSFHRDTARKPKEYFVAADLYEDMKDLQEHRQVSRPDRLSYTHTESMVSNIVSQPSLEEKGQRTQGAYNEFTSEDLRTLESRLMNEITRNTEINLQAEWLNLVFQDCGGQLGCDGCIDLKDQRMSGSDIAIKRAKDLYDEAKPKIPFADFVTLLGTVAARSSTDVSGLNIPFSIGRKDCVPPIVETEFPSGQDINVTQFLSKRFQVTLEEAVALMGGHSLGRARANQSGYVGPWDSTPRSLDSTYYLTLIQQNWTITEVNNSKTLSSQWNSTDWKMLHADMILLKDFTTSGSNHTPSCAFRTCPDKPVTSDYVRTFSRNQAYWLQVFSRAFLKMVSTGNFHLTPVK